MPIYEGQPVLSYGKPLSEASAAMIMIHGRGASATSILRVGEALGMPGVALLAPQAAHGTWYPQAFMSPIEWNEPGITSALKTISRVLAQVEAAGIPTERTLILGFSQGACLATEYAARNARRYLGIAGLSGGLIGPAGSLHGYPGSLDGTPVFLGCSDVDMHIPAERVRKTAAILETLGGDVTLRLYPGMGHDINEDEMRAVRAMLGGAPTRPTAPPG